MKHLLILLSFLLLSSPLYGQSERPETIIVPVSSLGDVSEVRKQILQNTLTDELKKHFRIVPQEKYEQVLEQVFEELEYEECSEDTCIMRVQEMLQVENVFNLQIIGEGKDSQLNLKWITLDEKKNEEDYCEGCGTGQLRKMIGGLVEKLVGEKPIVVRKKKGILFRDTPFSKFVEGGKKWFKTGDEKTQVKYEGDIVNGIPNGQGTETFIDGYKYVGGFKGGFKNGQGTDTYPDGGKYEGEWKDGKPNGQGTETYPDGYKYEGEFKVGEFHGQGTLTSPDGQKYVGEFKDSKRNGQGTETFPNGYKYVGEFKDGKPNGQGTETYPDGGKYEGEFKVGRPNGQGTLTSPDGYKYEGEFKDSKRNGQGTETHPDGYKYEGEFKDGEPNGQGTLIFGKGKWEGDNYIGEFKDRKQHGQGTYTYSDGRKYVGEWKNGKYNGQGTFTFPNGNKGIGEFRENNPLNITEYDKYGNIIGKFVNGVKQ